MINLGTVPSGSTLYIPFATYGGTNGESITCSNFAVTDIEIYKNGSTTQRSSDSGYTLLDTDGIDFDGITGIHGFSVDLSDNTDAGFYSVGAFYWIIVSAITVDSQTVNFIAATFRIGPAESVTGYSKMDVQYIEGSDATDQIRDSLVDDSTRIDGSAINALSAKIPTKSKLAGTDNADGSIEMDDATGNYPGSVGSVSGHTPQTGDNYPIVSSVVYGLSALKTILDAIKLITDQIKFSGTYVDAQVRGQDNIDFGALQKASLNASTPTSISGNVGGIAGIINTLDALKLSLNDLSALDVLNAIVSDATKLNGIDLNLLASHDPGETIAGSTDTMDANVVAIANDTISAAAIAAAAVTKIQSGLALESTLTEIKGAGFTAETLVAIKAAIDAINVSGIADAVLDEAMSGHVVAGTLGYYMRMIYGLAVGRLRIDDTAKQLVLYMPDGTTELARWNLYNSAGALASVNVFDRQRV